MQIQQIDAAITEKVARDEELSRKLGILISILGVADTTAFSMPIEMPELGTLEGKQVASLAGLAPISRQSGKWQGIERIQGGRAFLRRAIYMPALVATRYNPDLKAKYDARWTKVVRSQALTKTDTCLRSFGGYDEPEILPSSSC